MVDQIWVVPDAQIAELAAMGQDEIKQRVRELAKNGDVQFGAGSGVVRELTGGLKEASVEDVDRYLGADDIILSENCRGNGRFHSRTEIGVAKC